MAAHNELGQWGEQQAERFMRQKGWYIRHRDWRYHHTDIDLVCIDEDNTTLVFVEVKTRAKAENGDPVEAVDAEKRSNMIRASVAYRKMFRKENLDVRFDIVAIIGTDESDMQIEHIENAFDMITVYEDWTRPQSGVLHL